MRNGTTKISVIAFSPLLLSSAFSSALFATAVAIAPRTDLAAVTPALASAVSLLRRRATRRWPIIQRRRWPPPSPAPFYTAAQPGRCDVRPVAIRVHCLRRALAVLTLLSLPRVASCSSPLDSPCSPRPSSSASTLGLSHAGPCTAPGLNPLRLSCRVLPFRISSSHAVPSAPLHSDRKQRRSRSRSHRQRHPRRAQRPLLPRQRPPAP